MALTYKTTNTGWGLEAFFEGYKLVFPTTLEKGWLHKKIWKKFFLFAQTDPAKPKNNSSIVTSVNLYDLFSDSAKKTWQQAQAEARKRKSGLGVEDIFLSLLDKPSVKNLFRRTKTDTHAAETLLKNYLRLTPASSLSAVKTVPFEAFLMAIKLHNHKIGNLMLLGALLKAAPKDNILQAIFENIGLTYEKLELLSVWILNLDYGFQKNSQMAKLLYCCQQSQSLERHFGYSFELPAIETAVELSSNQTFKNLEHQKALQYLVKAAALAKNKGDKTISEKLVRQAAVAV